MLFSHLTHIYCMPIYHMLLNTVCRAPGPSGYLYLHCMTKMVAGFQKLIKPTLTSLASGLDVLIPSDMHDDEGISVGPINMHVYSIRCTPQSQRAEEHRSSQPWPPPLPLALACWWCCWPRRRRRSCRRRSTTGRAPTRCRPLGTA